MPGTVSSDSGLHPGARASGPSAYRWRDRGAGVAGQTASSDAARRVPCSGISVALITTAGGLIVAIPAVVAYNIFVKKIDRIQLDIEESATEVLDIISMEYKG